MVENDGVRGTLDRTINRRVVLKIYNVTQLKTVTLVVCKI